MSRQFQRKLTTLDAAGEFLGVGPWTVRRYIAEGRLTGYKVAGTRNVRVDVAEVEALLQPIPAADGGDVPQAS